MYSVFLQKQPKIFLKKIDKKERNRIIDKLKDLANNPELGKPLTGKLAKLWSLRIGDYRVLYQIRRDELLIFVLKIGHRKNIYD